MFNQYWGQWIHSGISQLSMLVTKFLYFYFKVFLVKYAFAKLKQSSMTLPNSIIKVLLEYLSFITLLQF